MITELVTGMFFALGAIGAILAMKWKNNNVKPRLTDKEVDQQNQKGLE